MAAAYQGGLDPEFIAMADVHLVVADTMYPAHSQFLAAESGVLRAVLRDTEPVPTAEQPWTTRSLDCYSSGTVESFLYHVYKSPLFHAKTQAWDMLDIADHLDCRRLLEAARAALESGDGQYIRDLRAYIHCQHCTVLPVSGPGHMQGTSVPVTQACQGSR